ncbi:1-aminocyclopropane-1-carboxylate deaminase/D-cysteine desulfhydrase [Halopseudomonas pertucinogena]|uniref:1-aminocyclopropane-1-carboxylate deaminase n=1 Tax=Halopseudomonas pertucinogena TaxID=86175 RepID=A0ABQ2CN08_9GAMM|nr:pyridoxal-phosphate dependent enzyme [Halopseudomonas pertucinogena]GGI96878.1 1-aminocyclopropane-1-carboxylate deaminase [Halopseudomonas pertucinogena]
MISTSIYASPLYRLEKLSRRWGVDLWIKRDDLIPLWLGGNKVRKNVAILDAASKGGRKPEVLITNGGAESNHARVVALMGAQLGCEVHLVLHGDKPALSTRGNSFFYRSAGAATHYVDSEQIGPTIVRLERASLQDGRSVVVIPGGGHAVEGVEAYSNAVAELPTAPDYIVHASGTGGTQAGLLAGVEKLGWSTSVTGISVARAGQRGREEIIKLLPCSFPLDKIHFRDGYRFGGYERHSPELVSFIQSVIRDEGIPLDLTYTGKAMFGLRDLVRSGEIPPGSMVVFWHTGGLLNLTSMNL